MLKKLVDEILFEKSFIDHPVFKLTPTTFSIEIEKLVKEYKIDYLEAVCKLCETFEIDYGAIPKLLTKTMKDKIEVAALERKYRI